MLEHVVDKLADFDTLQLSAFSEVGEHFLVKLDWKAELGTLVLELTAFTPLADIPHLTNRKRIILVERRS